MTIHLPKTSNSVVALNCSPPNITVQVYVPA